MFSLSHTETHCSVQDLAIIGLLYKGATAADARLLAGTVSIPDTLRNVLPAALLTPEAATYILPAARTAVWGVYGYFTGLFATGLWIIAHEAGHQAFSSYRLVNDVVGWVLHSGYVVSQKGSAFFSLTRFPE